MKNNFTAIEFLVVLSLVLIIGSMIFEGVKGKQERENNTIQITAKITKSWNDREVYYFSADKRIYILPGMEMFSLIDNGKLYKITYYHYNSGNYVLQLQEVTAEAP
jgi:hypothetical protein